MKTFNETIDGKHRVQYTNMGTLEERMERLEEAMGEPPSAVLSEVMPQRHKEGRISIQLQCSPCGFYIDSAPNMAAARNKARKLVEQNEEFHANHHRDTT